MWQWKKHVPGGLGTGPHGVLRSPWYNKTERYAADCSVVFCSVLQCGPSGPFAFWVCIHWFTQVRLTIMLLCKCSSFLDQLLSPRELSIFVTGTTCHCWFSLSPALRSPSPNRKKETSPWRPRPPYFTQKLQRIYKTSSILHWAALQTTLFRLMYTAIAILIRPQWFTSSYILHRYFFFDLFLGRGYLHMYLPFINVKQSTISVQAKDILSWLRLQLAGYQSQYQAFTYDKAKYCFSSQPPAK